MAVLKRNILLDDITERMAYTSSAHPVSKHYPTRDNVASHAKSIKSQYNSAMKKSLDQKQVAAIKMKGTYAEFSGVQGLELATKSLENRQTGIRLLNVQTIDGVTKATVYIPEGKEQFFLKRMEEYATEKTKTGKPKHQDLIGSIEHIKLALLESFWTDKQEALPNDTAINCEIWLRYEIQKKDPEPWNKVEEEFHRICDELGISVDKHKRILFPERIVKLITADKDNLVSLISGCEYITEMRRAEEPANFFTTLDKREQRLWKEDLLSRTSFSDSDASICILDAGINDQHPLLMKAIRGNGVHTVDQTWGTYDSPLWNGHGTEMAGLAAYNDLQEALETQGSVEVSHKIESVKILPNTGYNPSDLYGAITQRAVAIAEIENPQDHRVLCMAVTSSTDRPDQDGRPSSWSASIDEITSGATEEGHNHRLFVVSAGNVTPEAFVHGSYPEVNTLEPVQNPAQSWNAITVGGYTDKIEVSSDWLRGFHALAPLNTLSPFSTTSTLWRKIWPIKPEVLFKGGNIATNDEDYTGCDDLSLLTTGHRPSFSLFSTINATSAATAQAAFFCAKLMNEYPELWPETIRALMIHSATWTDEMHHQFCPKGDGTTKTQRGVLLRHCGYGIPDIEKAIQCANNSVNMIVQGEMQPFRKEGSVKMNEMHIHSFPWPNEVLRALGETEVKLRVTLSYFIEPSPGEIGWKDRYRYPSCGLRFEINKVNQSLQEFKKQVNKMAAEEDKQEETITATGNNWYLGINNRNIGSIHSDFIIGNAVDLYNRNYVAIYPVGGWWKERPYLLKTNSKIRYSLVVSLETPRIDIDLYTPIINQIGTTISVPTGR